jgi:hypothetical protein
MRNMLIAALLAWVTAGAANAQVAGLFGGDTIALQTNAVVAQVATSDGSVTNTLQPGPATDQSGSFSPAPITGEPLSLSMQPRPSDEMTLGGGVGGSFVDPDEIQLKGEAFSREFDLLRAAPHSAPFSFGRDRDIKFVESHTYRPGIPAPVGMSYPMPRQRVQFFGEIAPIFDATFANPLGWGGGFGIRINLGR